jgi:hypothetical protein
MENYLYENYKIENIKLSSPKKHSDFYVSKIKYSNNTNNDNSNSNGNSNFYLQLPVMKIMNFNSKELSMEFLKEGKYSEGCYTFLNNLNELILSQIILNSKEWFGKEIPKDSIKKMYNSFLKAPSTLNNNIFMNVGITKNTKYYDSKSIITEDPLVVGNLCESICQMKYLTFSKDTAFLVWELVSIKNIKIKTNKVKPYGFLDVPEEDLIDSEEYDEINETFFN